MKSKVLIADDSATIQKIIKITLAGEDFELIECQDETLLNGMVEDLAPDLVLLDFNLSEAKTGYDLALEIRERHPSKIILLYGTFDTIDDDLNKKMNINGHIVKPMDPNKFIHLCKDVLSESVLELEEFEDIDASEPIGEEWVVQQPVRQEQEVVADDILTEQEKNQLKAGVEDWGVEVPAVIDQDHDGVDLPPVISAGERDIQLEDDSIAPSDDDLEYPDMDAIKAEVASSEPTSSLTPIGELEDEVEEDEMEGIDLNATAGTNTIEEVKALESQIADEIEEEDDLWTADEEMEDPDSNIRQTDEVVHLDRDDTQSRRREDRRPEEIKPINTEVGEKTNPMVNISEFFPENLNQDIKEQVDPIVENIAREEVEKIIEKIVKAEVDKLADKVIEKVAWEIIPDLAENLIQKQLKHLADDVLSQS